MLLKDRFRLPVYIKKAQNKNWGLLSKFEPNSLHCKLLTGNIYKRNLKQLFYTFKFHWTFCDLSFCSHSVIDFVVLGQCYCSLFVPPIDADPEAATLSEMEDSKSSAEANLRLQQSDGVKSSESIPSFLAPELTLKCCCLLFLALLHCGPTV